MEIFPVCDSLAVEMIQIRFVSRTLTDSVTPFQKCCNLKSISLWNWKFQNGDFILQSYTEVYRFKIPLNLYWELILQKYWYVAIFLLGRVLHRLSAFLCFCWLFDKWFCLRCTPWMWTQLLLKNKPFRFTAKWHNFMDTFYLSDAECSGKKIWMQI